jgi:hypothetical protein
MAIVGAILLMARYKAINLKFAEDWEEEYKLSGASGAMDQIRENIETVDEDESEESVEEEKAPRARKMSKARANSTTTKRTVRKTPARRTTKTEAETSTRTPRAKKSS